MTDTAPISTRASARRRLGVLLGAAAFMLTAPPWASASPQNHLTPILDCVDVNGDGSITAHFGYSNSWSNRVSVPAGKTPPGQQNWFNPAPVDRGQPSQFEPGTYSDVFTVTFTPTPANPSLEWYLGDVNNEFSIAAASLSSPRCAPVPAFGVDSPLPAALVVVGLGIVLALRRVRPERVGA